MKTYRSTQSGLSMVSWLLVIVVVSIFVQAGVKLIPAYVDDYIVAKSLTSLSDHTSFSDMSALEIRKNLGKQLRVNGANSTEVSNGINMTSFDDKLTLTINYEKRIPFISNIDFILSFDHRLIRTSVNN